MTGREVLVATGNPAKLSMFGQFLTEAGFTPVMADPGDAEERAPGGYEAAVRAKLAGARKRAPVSGTPVLAHDCGFEFECLDGWPGARTKAWLSEVAGALGEVLVPGTSVRVVHWMALWDGGRVRLFHEHDDRTVPGDLILQNSQLPLTDTFTGPRNALARLMGRVIAEFPEREELER